MVKTRHWRPGTSISGRLLVYDGAYFTNEFGKQSWFAAPVFVEITNEMGFPTQIFFNWEKDVRFELRDANDKQADNLKQKSGSGYKPLDPTGGLCQPMAFCDCAPMEILRPYPWQRNAKNLVA